MRKKKWHLPKLVVITKFSPEEQVLVACKTLSQADPSGEDNGCTFWGLGCRGKCSDIVTS